MVAGAVRNCPSAQMAGVVDAADGGELMPVPLDLVDAGGAEVHPVEGVERDVEGPAQQNFYRRDVAYYQDSLTAVVSQQPVTGLVDPVRGVGEALSARGCLLGVVLPGGYGCGPSLPDFCQGKAFPFTEVGFAQIVICGNGQTQFGGCDGSGGDSAPQRRADNGV